MSEGLITDVFLTSWSLTEAAGGDHGDVGDVSRRHETFSVEKMTRTVQKASSGAGINTVTSRRPRKHSKSELVLNRPIKRHFNEYFSISSSISVSGLMALI